MKEDSLKTFKYFRKKVSQCRIKIQRGTLCFRPVWDVMLKEEQLLQFKKPVSNGTNWRRKILYNFWWNYFGKFVWTQKKVTIIIAFHFMKRRLKMALIPFPQHFSENKKSTDGIIFNGSLSLYTPYSKKGGHSETLLNTCIAHSNSADLLLSNNASDRLSGDFDKKNQ